MSYHHWHRLPHPEKNEMWGVCVVCGATLIKPGYPFADLTEVDGRYICTECLSKGPISLNPLIQDTLKKDCNNK